MLLAERAEVNDDDEAIHRPFASALPGRDPNPRTRQLACLNELREWGGTRAGSRKTGGTVVGAHASASRPNECAVARLGAVFDDAAGVTGPDAGIRPSAQLV